MKENKEVSAVDVMLVVTFLIPIYVLLAPRSIRMGVFIHTCRFIGLLILLAIIYTIYLITIKDKIRARRIKKEQEELERWQREQRQRWNKQREEKEKNKRED